MCFHITGVCGPREIHIQYLAISKSLLMTYAPMLNLSLTVQMDVKPQNGTKRTLSFFNNDTSERQARINYYSIHLVQRR